MCDAGWFISGEDRCCFLTVDQANDIDLELPSVVNQLLRFCSESLACFILEQEVSHQTFFPYNSYLRIFMSIFIPIFLPSYQGMFEDKINDPAVREYFEVPNGKDWGLQGLLKFQFVCSTARPWVWMFGMHGPSSSSWMKMVVVQWRLRHEGKKGVRPGLSKPKKNNKYVF